MKIIQAHNYYQNIGGEATSVANEKALLEEKGHQVISYTKNNKEIDSYSLPQKLALLKQASWSQKTYHEVSLLLKQEKPDICHVHNFLPLISPSIYYACKENNVPVVQTLHNYRLICTNGLFLKNGEVCESCLGKSPYKSITTKCYRNSYIQTYALARMLETNTKKGTWANFVDAYLCLTNLAREKFTAHGLPIEKLFIKPNFVELNNNVLPSKKPYLLFVGRLERSKGAHLLIDLCQQVDLPIKVIGEGNLENELKTCPQLTVLGKQSHVKTVEFIQQATALIFPSIWYEGMPMTILEAFASRTPVFASNMGAMQSMITDEKTGFLFTPDCSKSLAQKVNQNITQPKLLQEVAAKAFALYQELYSKESNYKIMMDIYHSVIKNYT